MIAMSITTAARSSSIATKPTILRFDHQTTGPLSSGPCHVRDCRGLRRHRGANGTKAPELKLTRSQENTAMQRVKHPPLRNKIDLAEPTQLRAWSRRLDVSVDSLRAVVDKVGNSVAAVTKEVELRRAGHQPSSAPIHSRSAKQAELPGRIDG
jgi:hypothetical protein